MVCPSRRCRACVVLCLLVLGAIVGIPVLIIHFGMIYGVSITVENASLATFAITTLTPTANSTPPPPTTTAAAVAVTYNLSMTVSVHNPNKKLAVHIAAPLEVRYSFDGALFGPLVRLGVDGNRLPAGGTSVYGLTVGAANESVPELGVHAVADFARQKWAGVFEVDVLVTGGYAVRGAKCGIAVTCLLKLPLGARPASSEKVVCI